MKKKLQIAFIMFFLCSPLVYSQLTSPVLILPNPDADFLSTNLTLTWQSVSGANGYFVEIATDANQILNGPVVSDSVNATSPQFVFSNGTLQTNTSYFWRVTARNSFGLGTPSGIRNFRTAGTPVQEINNLSNEVAALNLTNNQGNQLTQRLDQANHKLAQGKFDQAENKLESFEDRVEELRESGIISVSAQTQLNTGADYIIAVIQQGDHFGVQAHVNALPKVYSLDQNYPNPFNPSTTIEYSLPVNSFVSIKIYDILGKEITELISKEQNAGHYITFWNASNYSSGVYFYKLTAGNFTQIKKMLLAK